jgi:hypothetical protein
MVMLGVEFLSEGDLRRGLMPDSTLCRRNILLVWMCFVYLH